MLIIVLALRQTAAQDEEDLDNQIVDKVQNLVKKQIVDEDLKDKDSRSLIGVFPFNQAHDHHHDEQHNHDEHHPHDEHHEDDHHDDHHHVGLSIW